MNDFKKENLENMSYKDISYLILENSSSLNTLELFKKVVELLELPKSIIDNKIADFYTSLTTDKRFVMLDGKWDLRTRHPSDKVLVKVDDEDEDIVEESQEDEVEDEFEEDEYGDSDNSEDEFDDSDDDLKDLVVLDENELEED